MPFENVFTQVINLDSSTDRLASFTDQAARAGLPFVRCPAFDGRGRKPEDLSRYTPWRARLWFGRYLTGGEVGCFLSHREAVQRFLDSGMAYGLVLEDDVHLPEDIVETLRDLFAVIEAGRVPGWRLINLGRAAKVPNNSRPLAILEQAQGGSRALCHCLDFPLSTHALLWSRAGAARFLYKSKHITGTVDNWLRSDLAVHGGGYCLAPPFIGAGGVSVITAEPGAGAIRMVGGRKQGWWAFRSTWRGRWRKGCGQIRCRLGIR